MENYKVEKFLHTKVNKNKYFNEKKSHIKSEKNALLLFKRASVEIPAYKNFLKVSGFFPNKVRTIEEFKNVPCTSKENYILKYPLKDRCWGRKLNFAHTIAASSGSTGEPVFWPRELKQELDGAIIHEVLLKKIYDVENKKTLFINSFGLGNWIAGIFTEFCLYLLRLKGVPFTLASPGYNQEETFKIVKNFSRFYDQTIIACHPPILKMMVESGLKDGINWKKLNTKFLGAGEGFSENWRDYLSMLVGQKDVLKTMINIYGSADAGLMGFETPLSIYLRRITSEHHILNDKLFHSNRNPYLYQFDPTYKYLEAGVDGEILVTANATAPLIRYNIHDKGGIFQYRDLLKLTKAYKKNIFKSASGKDLQKDFWTLPFVYIFGRDKFMISLYGVNIYPENIKSVLEHPSLQPFFTGRFLFQKETNRNQDGFLLLRVELNSGVTKSRYLSERLKDMFVKILKKLNSEYNQVEEKYGKKMHPVISLYVYQDKTFFPKDIIKKMA